ncbi:glycosyltransferase [Planotetraspora sp. A-T 1434]|uniref:glycosyltransferase n=1 Tax=Planotetraspora sp. A-T 1434 TaxID=2979219 RepID=UPI0021C11BB1|nr:glycosyltransferase [Planotetraspora sp. A-T 1434]MCT9931980.1 glycosyltransferase [Planotetraspora sp. A-T 1434]
MSGGLLVYFAGSYYDGSVAGTDRHVADRLAAEHDVLYVNPPVAVAGRRPRPDLAATRERPPLDRVGPRLTLLTFRVPPARSRPGVYQLSVALTRRAVRRALRQMRRPVDAVIVANYDNVLGTIKNARTLFYATDDIVAGARMMGLPVRTMIRAEARQLRKADIVAVVSPALRDRFDALGRRAELVPNGCDVAAYAEVDSAPPPPDVAFTAGDGPVAGFVGNINQRIDIAVLEAVAANGPLLLVGPRHPDFAPGRFEALVGLPNVHWVGHKAFEELPPYLRLIDVGLTPYADTAFNRASFPLKTLEYLAAGRAVVSSELPATALLRDEDDGRELIRVAGSPEGFVKAVAEAAREPRTDDLIARRRAFAARHDWSQRALALAGLLDIEMREVSRA